MKKKVLGKITAIEYGIGGYQDAMFGVTISFDLSGWGCVSDFKGTWAYGIVDPDKHTKWTEEEREKLVADTAKWLCQTLVKAKKRRVQDLVGVPVEAEVDDYRLASWRILEEVL